jgi:hypothetical protein
LEEQLWQLSVLGSIMIPLAFLDFVIAFIRRMVLRRNNRHHHRKQQQQE